jgi:hypothetical protein
MVAADLQVQQGDLIFCGGRDRYCERRALGVAAMPRPTLASVLLAFSYAEQSMQILVPVPCRPPHAAAMMI